MPEVECPYCHARAVLVQPTEIGYPYPEDWGPAWMCCPCDAYVGCYAGSDKPLGTLANADLREWRRRAHVALDALWRWAPSPSEARTEVYRWLGRMLGINDPHIGRMDAETCRRVIAVCAGRRIGRIGGFDDSTVVRR